MDLIKGLLNFDVKSFGDPYNGKQSFSKLAEYMQIAFDGLKDNSVSAMAVAKALWSIKTDRLYEDYPIPGSNPPSVYTDFYKFCEACFGCKKSTIYNHLQIFERFGASVANSMSDYTYTQLSLMLPLSDFELVNIKPDWSCSRIKKYAKECKADREVSNRLENESQEAAESVEEYEPFLLNNDDQRRAFLKTYRRWTKCADCEVVNTHVTFYTICLDKKVLVAVDTTYDNLSAVSYYLFCPTDKTFCSGYGIYDSGSHLSLCWSTSENVIIKFIRDRKIKSLDILKE